MVVVVHLVVGARVQRVNAGVTRFRHIPHAVFHVAEENAARLQRVAGIHLAQNREIRAV